ncbi:helix-turn-helix transcriptional regulator [Cryptosporangium sp. NPDC048952]|uniref:helix-turn-helix transcriptional regulator n=1 Tax=Cryptosporangium sp. NPDC048952 TaxID=3363961 RepID=UPI003720A2E0
MAPSEFVPRRSLSLISSPDEAREILAASFGAGLRVGRGLTRDWLVSVRQVAVGGFVSSQVRLPAEMNFTVEGLEDAVMLSTVLAGRGSYERGRTVTRYVPGDVLVGSYPGVEWDCRSHESDVLAVVLRLPLLRAMSGDSTDEPARPWKSLAYEPSPGRAGQWRQAVRFVNELLLTPQVPASPLVIGAAGRLLAATALAVFPNTMTTEPTSQDRRDAHPDALRRAVASIEANPDQDLTLSDVARAAHVTPRAIQIAFRRHLDTTPMAYLRRVRLDRAHADLCAAGPGEGVTVTAVAARWGFAQPGRFAADYRAAYGRAPSRTLREHFG